MSLSHIHVLRGFHPLRAFVGPRCGDTLMDIEEMERVPGLFRGWELPLILQPVTGYQQWTLLQIILRLKQCQPVRRAISCC